jgi:hypothetical protein
MNVKLKPLCGGKFVIPRHDTQSVDILIFGSSVIWPCVYGETDRNHFMLENSWFFRACMCIF